MVEVYQEAAVAVVDQEIEQHLAKRDAEAALKLDRVRREIEQIYARMYSGRMAQSPSRLFLDDFEVEAGCVTSTDVTSDRSSL